jgi:hypothetical protein
VLYTSCYTVVGRVKEAGGVCLNPQAPGIMAKYDDVVSGVCSDDTSLVVKYGAIEIREGLNISPSKV